MITLEFPDGTKKEFEEGIQLIEVVKSISTSLAKKVLAGKLNDVLIDTKSAIKENGKIVFITTDTEEGFEIINHSTAHLMAAAIKNLFPQTKFGVGPATTEGFYYDVDVEPAIKEEDLKKIEKEMTRLVKQNIEFEREEITFAQAREIFASDEYKLYLIDKIENLGESISIYHLGNFVDLCRGVHVPSTKHLKYFKLLSIAGAYWLGDSNNKVLQRLYGTAHFTKENLDEYIELLKERAERDHRKLGKELNIFTFTKETGQGLPLWLPHGATIRYELETFIKREELKRGYQHVYSPTLGTKDLYVTSGHWAHYQEDMFAPIEMDNETFVLRPMSCPHHMMIYKSELRSYRDLPVRIAELAELYRFEASGALLGLERARSLNLADGHIFVRPDQIKEEFSAVLDLIYFVIETLGLDLSYMRLSLRDPEDKEKYYENDGMWDQAENELREVLNENNVEYIEAIGEAAFYGPKLDVQIRTALGHDITLGTAQLDFLLPEKFDLTYIDENGEKARPVVIHRGVISTMERMVATLLEQTKGNFPTWLAPIQVKILPVSLKAHLEYAREIEQLLAGNEIRVKLDTREEKLNYKIRQAQISKTPYTLIIGDDEIAKRTVTIRPYGKQENITIPIDAFVDQLVKEIKNRSKERLTDE